MSVDLIQFRKIKEALEPASVVLVAVSKIKSEAEIMQLYDAGQRDFGENYVQELVEKQQKLPADIRWHFIGHLQRNKVKYIAPFVHLIHGVDTLSLLSEINKQGAKLNRTIHCLLQVHIAQEETKFGFNEPELTEAIRQVEQPGAHTNVIIDGLMGMASFSSDMDKVKNEMVVLKTLYDHLKNTSTDNLNFTILSMGMSGDYQLAIEQGSNMVRIGSLLFGARL